MTFFSSIFLCSFLDHGPNTLDYFSIIDEIEDPDLTAVRLMTKTTMLVKDNYNQGVENSIVGLLSGPDVFPLNPSYRMIWFNWIISNRFLSDPRVLKKGTLTGIYCIYEKKHENVIRNSLKIIEDTLKLYTEQYKDIEILIREIIGLDSSNQVQMKHYQALQMKKNSKIIVGPLNKNLEQNIRNKEVKQASKKYINETQIFKTILETMVFRKNTPDEIKSQKQKREFWKSLIIDLDNLIKEKVPILKLKQFNKTQMELVFNQLAEAKIWKKLPIRTEISSIQSSSIAQFFLYYWLAYHKLLDNENILKDYPPKL